MNVLITGVSGYIGRRLVERLSGEPWVETVTGIDVVQPGPVRGKLDFVQCDVRDSLEGVFKGRTIDCVVHAAYILPPIHDTRLMEDINVNGTINVFTTAAAHSVSQILECSSATAYGFHPDNPPLLTEESPLRGNDDFTYAKNKREIETWLKGFAREHPDVVLTVVRPCFVVGPGFTNPLARHLTRKVCMLPRKTAEFQFIHEDDLVEIMAILIREKKPGVYNLAADGVMEFGEMLEMLGSIPLRLPMWLLGPLNDLAWKLRLRFLTEFPTPALNLVRYRWIVSNEKVKRELGYTFTYTTRTAFADFAGHVRRQGRRHGVSA